MITGLLAGAGISIFKSLIEKNGEELVSKGIEKVTGIKLDGKTALTAQEKKMLYDKEEVILRLDFDKLKEENRSLDVNDVNVTERHKSDNEHNVTRLVRPISFLFMLIIFTFMIFFDGNVGEFTVNPAYHSIVEGLLVTMVIFYFGSRGIEKTMKHIKGR